MKAHSIKYYKDGHKDVPYCSACGAEGDELLLTCPGEYVSPPTQPNNKDIVGNSIDRRKEHS